MKLRGPFVSACLVMATGCAPSVDSYLERDGRVIPAEEFTKSVRAGKGNEYSIFRSRSAAAGVAEGEVGLAPAEAPSARAALAGEGAVLKRTLGSSTPMTEAAASLGAEEQSAQNVPPPPGSYAPYAARHMTTNPSLWPDEGDGAFLFQDYRAIQPMDVITILVNDKSEGIRKAKTDTESKYSILAGISHLFGWETDTLQANNSSLDPEALVEANTKYKFEGEGETNRSGKLKAELSAVVMERLPNGLLRVEGTKIVSVNNEEEVMVVSGLVRPRDVDSQNRIESNRIANMRIDFYGRGTVSENQSEGWAGRILRRIWPF